MKAWPDTAPGRFVPSRSLHRGPALRPEDVFGPEPTPAAPAAEAPVSAQAPAAAPAAAVAAVPVAVAPATAVAVPHQPLSPRERAAVLARIQSLIDFWGITPEELAAEPEPSAAPPAPAVPSVRYRHPKTGDTWDGQGPHPEWLRHALLKEGYRVDELKPVSEPPATT
jgi:DNA-binding protein H-NS